MRNTRLLLLLVFTIFGFLGLFLWERGFHNFAVLVPLVPMVSSLLLFLFSFFEVDRTPNGEFYFKESNPYLRLMRHVFCGCDSLKSDQISICKLHGFSMILVVSCAAIGFVLFLFGWGMFAILSGVVRFHFENLQRLFVVLGVACGVIGMVFLIVWMMVNKKRWLSKLGIFLFVLICGGFCFFILVIFPIFRIMKVYNPSFLWAIAYYLGFVVGVVGATAAVVFIVVTAVKYIPAFKETWLGQIFLSVHKKLCPMIRLETPPETPQEQ